MSWYRQQLEDWLSELDIKADMVLDVGGAQGLVKNRVKSWNVKEYEVLDLPKWNLELPSNLWRNHRKADAIFCLEVFEYLIDPCQALAHINQLLKSGGIAYITFAFNYPHHNELEFEGLRYTEPGIRRIAKRVHINISNIWYRTDKSGLLAKFYGADGMHPAKQYIHHDVTGFIVEFTK